MKVQQETSPYRPITIKLEKQFEAAAFFGLIDKVEAFRCHANATLELDQDEIALIIEFSNLRSDMKVTI